MMRSKVFSILLILLTQSLVAHLELGGVVLDPAGRPIPGIEVYLRQTGGLETTAADGSAPPPCVLLAALAAVRNEYTASNRCRNWLPTSNSVAWLER